MRVILVFLALALLAGCESLPRRVLVPVPIPCEVAVPAEPDWATRDLNEKSTIWEQARALLAERRQRIAYEAELRAALDACRSAPKPGAL